MKISAIKIYNHSNTSNLSKLLERAKQPLSTQDKFEMSNKNASNINSSVSKVGCGCYGCGGCTI